MSEYVPKRAGEERLTSNFEGRIERVTKMCAIKTVKANANGPNGAVFYWAWMGRI